MDKKIILYIVTQSEFGGAQRYVLDLASNLKEEYEIIVAFGESGEKGELVYLLDKENISFHHLTHLKREINLFHDILAIFEIMKLISELKPDIIHLNSSKTSIVGSFASIFSKTKILYTAHGWVFNEPLTKAKKSLYIWLEKLTANFKSKIICVSEYDRREGIKNKIANETKLITIHNGIKPVKHLSKEKARQILWSYISKVDILPNQLLIGSIGNLYKTKGYEYLIEAISILKKENNIIKLVIIGDGQEMKKLKLLTRKLELDDFVAFTGRIPGAAKLLKAFDFYICSSVKEGLSYTIIEAMIAGLPIIATKVGGNNELVQHEKTGLLVQSKNPEAIVKALKKYLEDKNLIDKASINAHNFALDNFMFEQMIQKTKTIYKD
jgi:glycosyltransferase involved in cell wall biosynthesis